MEDGPSFAIVLAAGRGVRFGAPKQFATVAGLRLVDLAVEQAVRSCDHVILVLPAGRRWTGMPVDVVVEGGLDRSASVRAGLDAIGELRGVVVVHQAANPFASAELFDALISEVRGGAAAVFPGLRPADLVRFAEGDLAGAVVGRDELVLVQTPAAFRLDVLRAAHAFDSDALEDTARVSAAGFGVRIIPGDPRNVHVATPADLEIVLALLRQREQ